MDARSGCFDASADINAAYLVLIFDALVKIMSHAIFHNIDLADPLDISAGSGGALRPYNVTDFKNAMESAGHYVCGGNFL